LSDIFLCENHPKPLLAEIGRNLPPLSPSIHTPLPSFLWISV
jgi:hypothetical protein